MGFIRWFKNWNPFDKKPAKIYHSMIDENVLDDLKREKEVAGKEIVRLRKKVATQDEQLMEYKKKETEEKEKSKSKDLNKEIAINLQGQQKEINKERYGRWFSLRKFFRKLEKDKKFRDSFEVADMNDEVSWRFGEKGDIQISTKKLWGIFDNDGKARAISPTLSGLIYKPESIFNQVKRKRILLARDKEGEYLEGLDEQEGMNEIEMEIPIYDEETKKYKNTKVLSEKARDVIISLQDKLRKLGERFEIVEMAKINLSDENEELKRLNKALLFAKEKGKTAISEAYDTLLSHGMELAGIHNKQANLQERNVLLEKEVMVIKDVNKSLLNQIEEIGDKDSYKRALANIESIREFERSNPIHIIEREAKANAPPANATKQNNG